MNLSVIRLRLKQTRFGLSIVFFAAMLGVCVSTCNAQKKKEVPVPGNKQTQEQAETKIVLPAVASKQIDVACADASQWMFVDDGWEMGTKKSSQHTSFLSLHKKKSNYKPFHRSPTHIALLKEVSFEDFQLDVDVLSTHKDYNHRDVCFFFGYQAPGMYYYVHLGKKMDPNANQIFIVNKAPRTKISLTTTEGTNWDDNWHKVRIIRDSKSGKIEVYYDDMTKPVMTAKDTTFGRGLVGLGSFDDTADFDNLTIKPLVSPKQ